MKKRVALIALVFAFNTFSVPASASFLGQLIDWEKVVVTLFNTSEKMNKKLEEIRLSHHEKYDHSKQWEMLCDGTNVLKQNFEMLDLLLNKYNLMAPACLPVSRAIKFQTAVMGRCMDYYHKEVQLNFDNNFAEFALMLEDSKAALNECYPWLGLVE